MVQIGIRGVGCTISPGTPKINESFKEMLVEAVYKSIEDAQIYPSDIDGASFSYAGEGEIGHGGIVPTLVDAIGLAPLDGYINIGNCASAHMAFMQGCQMIESQRFKNVLVAGFDKLTDVIPFENYMLMSTDSLYDYNLGFSHIDAFLLQQEYVNKYNLDSQVVKQGLLKFSRLMRENASINSTASGYQKDVPSDEKLSQLPLYGNAMQAGEGASALILSAIPELESINYDRVVIAGRRLINTSHYIGHRYDTRLLTSNDELGLYNGIPLANCIQDCYEQAGITSEDLDILELYDQGYNSFISIEAAQLCHPGGGINYLLNDYDEQSLLINPDGGNIGRGHAAGGASLYQVIEIVKQLQGRAEGKQTKQRHYGLSTVIGGSYATSSAVALENMDWNNVK